MSERDDDYTPPPTAPESERLAVLEAGNREIKGRLLDGVASFAELREAFNASASATAGALGELEERWSGKFAAVAAAHAIALEASAPKPKPVPWLGIAGLTLAVILPIGSVIWTAARYPDRAEFADVQRKVNELDTAEKLRGRDVDEIKASLHRVEEALSRVASPAPARGGKP